MAEDHRPRQVVASRKELLTDPEQVVLRLLLERDAGPNAGVDEEKAAFTMGERQAAKEREVLRWKARRRPGAARPERHVVARERRAAAVGDVDVAVAPGDSEIGEQHVLMVAAQKDGRRRLALQAQQALDERSHARAAIDVVAEEDERVSGAGAEMLEQHVELVGTAVEIADRKDGHQLLPSTRRRSPSGSPSTSSAAAYGSCVPSRTRSTSAAYAPPIRASMRPASVAPRTSRSSRTRCSAAARCALPSVVT